MLALGWSPEERSPRVPPWSPRLLSTCEQRPVQRSQEPNQPPSAWGGALECDLEAATVLSWSLGGQRGRLRRGIAQVGMTSLLPPLLPSFPASSLLPPPA